MFSLLFFMLSHYLFWIVLSIIIYLYRHQLLYLINKFTVQRAHLRFLREQTLNRYDAKARLELGLSELHLGNLGEAIRLFKEALDTDPENALLHYNLGIAYIKGRNFPAAIQEFESCLNLKRDFGVDQVLIKLGDVYRFEKDYPTALSFYLQVLEINPYSGESLYKIGLSNYLLKSYPEAKKYTTRAIQEIKALPKFRYKKERFWLYQSMMLKLLLILRFL